VWARADGHIRSFLSTVRAQIRLFLADVGLLISIHAASLQRFRRSFFATSSA